MIFSRGAADFFTCIFAKIGAFLKKFIFLKLFYFFKKKRWFFGRFFCFLRPAFGHGRLGHPQSLEDFNYFLFLKLSYFGDKHLISFEDNTFFQIFIFHTALLERVATTGSYWQGSSYIVGRCEKWKFGKLYCPEMKIGACHKKKTVL